MSFRAVAEAVIHFESFRNIDLFHQGIYFIRTSLYYQKDANISQPGQSQQKRKKKNLDHHSIIPANIDKSLFTFNTRAFMIRYCEEEVELNDIGHFRVELDLEESQPSSIEFFMEVELMFSDLLSQGGPEKFSQQNNLKEIEGNVDFKCVSVQKYKLKKLCDGVFEYVPIIFDEQHFCVTLCTVHSSLLDFRFRSRPLKPFSRAEYQKTLQQQEQQVKLNDDNKINIGSKKSKDSKEQEWKPSNIAEYLFSNEKGDIADDIDSSEVDQIYNGYMTALINSYEKLKGKFNNFAAKCLSERQKRESGLILVAPPIMLPADQDTQEYENEGMTEEYKNQAKQDQNLEGTSQVRMGARIGQKMTKALKKQEIGIGAMNNQTVRQEDDSLREEEEDDRFIDLGSGVHSPLKNPIEDEPEREPGHSGIEGNITFSLIENVNPQRNIQPSLAQHNKLGSNKKLQQDDDEEYNLSHEASINISETNESILEMKKVTTIPILKNIDRLKNKTTKENEYQKIANQLVLSQRVQSSDPYQISFQLVQDINFVSSQVFQLWHKLIEILTINPKFVCELLRIQYEEKMRECWGEHIYRTIIETNDFSVPSEENVGEIHRQIALKRRNGPNGTLISTSFDQFNIIEVGSQSLQSGTSNINPIQELQRAAMLSPNGQTTTPNIQKALNDLHPILFEECYVKCLDKIKQQQAEASLHPFNEYNYKGVHLFVMVHGFQGNSCDMRLLKNNIALLFPEAMFLCSSANEEYTEGDIAEMGVRLAQEVNSYITQYCPGSSLGKISFIAHSLGGLITRAALPYLEEHSDKMYNFFTLSSPHLGYMYNQSKIVDAGMWFLKTWRKSKCLQQLRMTDSKNLEESLLYKLSEMKGLNWFKHIVLVSSYQDSYAPFDSARIQICNKAASDTSKGNIYIKMAKNILSNLPIDVLYRMDVDFRISEKNLDSLIGRTAHIQFLECQNLMKMLINRFKEFFC